MSDGFAINTANVEGDLISNERMVLQRQGCPARIELWRSQESGLAKETKPDVQFKPNHAPYMHISETYRR